MADRRIALSTSPLPPPAPSHPLSVTTHCSYSPTRGGASGGGCTGVPGGGGGGSRSLRHSGPVLEESRRHLIKQTTFENFYLRWAPSHTTTRVCTLRGGWLTEVKARQYISSRRHFIAAFFLSPGLPYTNGITYFPLSLT